MNTTPLSLGPDQIPQFSPDTLSVGRWTISGTEVVARILIPLEPAPGMYVPWRDVGSAPVTGSTRWSELISRVPGPPYVYVDEVTADRIASVLENEGKSTDFIAGFSQVYCNDTLPSVGEKVAVDMSDEFEQADFYQCGDLAWLRTVTHENNCHFPIVIWPLDVAWSLAAPLYSDSWFFSGPRTLYNSFVGRGLEIYPIPRDALCPAEGD